MESRPKVIIEIFPEEIEEHFGGYGSVDMHVSALSFLNGDKTINFLNLMVLRLLKVAEEVSHHVFVVILEEANEDFEGQFILEERVQRVGFDGL